MRLFADDSSLFFISINDVDQTHETIEQDLSTITNWAYKWKMVFNPDITKQAVEVIFSVKHPATLNLYLMGYMLLEKIEQNI